MDVKREAVHLFSPQRCVPDRDIDSPGTVGLTSLPEAGTGSQTHTNSLDSHSHFFLFIYFSWKEKHWLNDNEYLTQLNWI